ncbi:hypothetical protein IKO_04655 [Bacillus cereus VDM034]|nr:hypothetical protein IKO_04655 [Bacillus cereus VDM034]
MLLMEETKFRLLFCFTVPRGTVKQKRLGIIGIT